MKNGHGKRGMVALEENDVTITISFTRYLADGTEETVTASANKIRKRNP